MWKANRTVQSTELFIGTCKLLSILADVTMKVTSNLLTNSNLWSIQTLLVLTTANTFYYKTDFRTAAATFYCCEPSSTCPDQQCLTQGSRLNQQDLSLHQIFNWAAVIGQQLVRSADRRSSVVVITFKGRDMYISIYLFWIHWADPVLALHYLFLW